MEYSIESKHFRVQPMQFDRQQENVKHTNRNDSQYDKSIVSKHYSTVLNFIFYII